MFERYSEKARRVMLFARYEASQLGSSRMESEHLLLGLLRQDRALMKSVLSPDESLDTIRDKIVAHRPLGKRISTSVDMPLSADCTRILKFAAVEAKNEQVRLEHLLLGILLEERCFAAQLLRASGAEPDAIRQRIAATKPVRNPATEAMTQRGDELRRTLIERHAKIAAEKIVGLKELTVDGVASIIAEEFNASSNWLNRP